MLSALHSLLYPLLSTAVQANFKSTLFCGRWLNSIIFLPSAAIIFGGSTDCNVWSMTEYSFTIKFNSERGWELDSRWRGETSISKNPLKIVSYFICGCPGCISSSELYQVKGLSWQASLLSDPNIWNISSKFQPLNFLTFSNKFRELWDLQSALSEMITFSSRWKKTIVLLYYNYDIGQS